MQKSGILETLASPIPCALALAMVVFLPSGGFWRVVAATAVIVMVPLAYSARKGGNTGRFRLVVALGAGLMLGIFSHLRADGLASAGGGGFLKVPDPGFSLPPLVAMQGLVVSDARRASGGLLYIELAVLGVHGTDQAWVGATGRVTIFIRGAWAPPRGSTILVACRPTTDIRPAVRARVFTDSRDVQVLKPAPLAEAWRTRVRAGMLAALGDAGAEAGPLLEALFLGVRDELDSTLANAFRDAGCAHILALSGQHVGILAALVAMILGPVIGKSRAKPAACVLAALYLVLVGPSPSVTRAIFMFWTAAALVAADRPQKSETILSLVFVGAALIDPPSVRTLSFQLSYLAVAGIADRKSTRLNSSH